MCNIMKLNTIKDILPRNEHFSVISWFVCDHIVRDTNHNNLNFLLTN